MARINGLRKMKPVKSINLCKSVVQTVYDIVEAHGGELKVESKDVEDSEFMIARKDTLIMARINSLREMKSVKSVNLCKSVVQTIYDIVKAHGGELKLKTKESDGSDFTIILPMVKL